MIGRIARAATFVTIVAVLTGCASALGPRVVVLNETDLVFTIAADGTWVGTVGPRSTATLAFPLGEESTEVTATDPQGRVLAALLGTRAMYEEALGGSNPMSVWQDLECGRILLATEPFDPALAGPVPNPCP